MDQYILMANQNQQYMDQYMTANLEPAILSSPCSGMKNQDIEDWIQACFPQTSGNNLPCFPDPEFVDFNAIVPEDLEISELAMSHFNDIKLDYDLSFDFNVLQEIAQNSFSSTEDNQRHIAVEMYESGYESTKISSSGSNSSPLSKISSNIAEDIDNQSKCSTPPCDSASSQSDSFSSKVADDSSETIELSENEQENKDKSDNNSKPIGSYVEMISKAISADPSGHVMLGDIYKYIEQHYPAFCSKGTLAWKNSIRHNLSINDCFIKQAKSANGRGYFWTIHPACREDFKKGDYNRRKARSKVQQYIRKQLSANKEMESLVYQVYGGNQKMQRHNQVTQQPTNQGTVNPIAFSTPVSDFRQHQIILSMQFNNVAGNSNPNHGRYLLENNSRLNMAQNGYWFASSDICGQNGALNSGSNTQTQGYNYPGQITSNEGAYSTNEMYAVKNGRDLSSAWY